MTAGTRLPFALEVVAFADEEGARFGTAFLGSSVLAGGFDAATLGRADADGVSLEEAIRAFGGDPGGLAGAARAAGSLVGYAEVHIEQGPVLEERGLALGVVSGIAGQTRAALCFEGATGHAGTVPMELRRDALCAAAELVVEVEAVARGTPGLVATVGELTPEPGAPNVIPGRARLSLDVRHADDAARSARDRTPARARRRDRRGAPGRPGVGSAARPGRRPLRPRAHRGHGASGAGHRLAVVAPPERRRARRSGARGNRARGDAVRAL